MLRSAVRIYCLFLLVCMFFLAAPAFAATYGTAQKNAAPAFPAVDPQYVYNQLFYMGTHFLRREAGYDNNLPSMLNGHDEFAAYWTQEIMHNLQGFGAQVRRDGLGGGDDVAHVGLAMLVQRRGDADDDGVHLCDLRVVAGR